MKQFPSLPEKQCTKCYLPFSERKGKQSKVTKWVTDGSKTFKKIKIKVYVLSFKNYVLTCHQWRVALSCFFQTGENESWVKWREHISLSYSATIFWVPTMFQMPIRAVWSQEDFPGGPAAKAPHSQSRGPRLDSTLGELDPPCHS